jgi:hypothetical protein
MAEVSSSTFNLELVASFNFNPSRQLHPSSTSILLANFIPRRHSYSNPHRCAISSILLDGRRGVLDATAAR